MYTSQPTNQPTKHTRADREKGHTKNDDDDISDERMKKKLIKNHQNRK